jgi:hypothetical protein
MLRIILSHNFSVVNLFPAVYRAVGKREMCVDLLFVEQFRYRVSKYPA